MAIHSSVLAWRIPGAGEPGVHEVTKSRTRLSDFTSNEHPGLISFRMDWLELLAVQGTLKSLFQHHSSKASTAIIRMYLCFGIWSFCYSFKMKNYAIILLSRIANVSDVTWWCQG